MARSRTTERTTAAAQALQPTPAHRTSNSSAAAVAAAMFSYDFVDDGVDYDTLEALHRGEISSWIEALAQSGLLAEAEVAAVAREWGERPSLLLDALLTDADEMTVRRCRLAWASMDRLAPFTLPIAHSG
ncbi:hypothetical protein [Rhodococcoides corynebacterioides]|uniref:hypothetical protein n=1 Tax=Rhodococcoides corynebacterioides TaxID=53972 RepID=UPI003530560A